MKHKFLTFVLSIVAVLSFASCQKQDPDTTYTINFLKSASMIELAQKYNATLEEQILVMEYNDLGECVKTQSADLTGGGKKTFLAAPGAKKITIRLDEEMERDGKTLLDESKWLQTITYLKDGKDTMVEISGKTIIGNYEPNVK